MSKDYEVEVTVDDDGTERATIVMKNEPKKEVPKKETQKEVKETN